MSLICGILKNKLKFKKKTHGYREQICDYQKQVCGGGGRGVCGKMGEMSQGGAKVQTSSCKINKSWECNIQHGDYS